MRRTYRVPFTLIEKLTTMRYTDLFLLWVSTIVVFGLIYFGLSYVPGNHSASSLQAMSEGLRFLNSLYFSVITSTTVGYGDLVPHGISKIFVSIQSVSGVFLGAIFVAKLVSYRQEVTLDRVHKLTFEDVFNSVREGFFIIRKDFDALMRQMKDGKPLTEHDWENLIVAYRQGQSLFEEIPEFYGLEPHLYTIDAKRESLLLDAVQRTLDRLSQLLTTMTEQNIDWRTSTSTDELHGFLAIAETTIPIWQERSPYEQTAGFKNLKMTVEKLRLQMRETTKQPKKIRRTDRAT